MWARRTDVQIFATYSKYNIIIVVFVVQLTVFRLACISRGVPFEFRFIIVFFFFVFESYFVIRFDTGKSEKPVSAASSCIICTRILYNNIILLYLRVYYAPSQKLKTRVSLHFLSTRPIGNLLQLNGSKAFLRVLDCVKTAVWSVPVTRRLLLRTRQTQKEP